MLGWLAVPFLRVGEVIWSSRLQKERSKQLALDLSRMQLFSTSSFTNAFNLSKKKQGTTRNERGDSGHNNHLSLTPPPKQSNIKTTEVKKKEHEGVMESRKTYRLRSLPCRNSTKPGNIGALCISNAGRKCRQ